MEGNASEAAFDACNLNPQRFVNEVLNSVDDMLDGAFDFALQQSSEITASGDPSGTTERSEELARGVSSVRQLTQAVLDKRMQMWEKYCLRHCFSVPEGFVLPKHQDSSSGGALFQEGLTDTELDSQLDSLRNKLSTVRKKSVDMQKVINSLENQSTVNNRYHSYVTESLQLFEQNSANKMFQEVGETVSKLQLRIEEAKIKRKVDKESTRVGITNSPNKKQYMAHDLNIFAKLDYIQDAATILRNV